MVLRPSAVEVDDTLDALVEQQQSSEQRGSDAGGADAARRHHTGEPAHEALSAACWKMMLRPAPSRSTTRSMLVSSSRAASSVARMPAEPMRHADTAPARQPEKPRRRGQLHDA